MVMLAVLSLLVGLLLGLRFKVLALVPAILLSLALSLFIESVCGYDLWRLTTSAGLVIVGVQLGYLIGSVATNDLDSAIEQNHVAVAAILRGDPSVAKALYSDQDDVTLGTPFGPYARGRTKVEETLTGTASKYRDGEVTVVEPVARYVSDDLACIVEVERGRSKVGGADEITPVALRVTSVFRLERRVWKLVHLEAESNYDVTPVAP
jgi:Domain of unknown function (DUF4440)